MRIYRVVGAAEAVLDTATGTASLGVIDTVSGGALIAGAVHTDEGSGITWTGVATEDFDGTIGQSTYIDRAGSASENVAATDAARSAGGGTGAANNAWVVISLEPAP